MNLISELVEVANMKTLEHAGNIMLEMVKQFRQQTLNEGEIANNRGDLERKFDHLEQILISANKSLSSINRSNNGLSNEERNQLRGQILGRMNKIRSALYNIMIEMGMNEKEIEYHLNRMQLDTKYGKPSDTFTFDYDKISNDNVPHYNSENNDGRSEKEHKQAFSNYINKLRNTTTPDDVGNFIKPKTKAQSRAWVDRIKGFFN